MQADITAVQERVADADSYRLTADIEQTFLPRAVPHMIGERDTRLDFRLAGEVTPPDKSVLRLQAEDGGALSEPLLLIQEGPHSYIEKDGELVPSQNFNGGSLSGDFLDYLSAAKEISLTREGRHLRYEFDIDGPAYARYVERQLTALNGTPLAGQRPLGNLAEATGSGTLWVSPAGYPVRHELTINIPAISPDYDLRLRAVVHFADFNGVESMATPYFDSGSGTWQVQETQLGRPPLSSNTPFSGFFFIRTLQNTNLWLGLMATTAVFLSLLLLAYLYQRYPKATYRGIAIGLALVLLFDPILRIGQLSYTAVKLAEAAPPANPILELYGMDNADLNTTDANRDTTHNLELDDARRPLNTPAQQNAPNFVNDVTCGSIAPGPDTDKDSLSDVVESCLGTDPYAKDTDLDGIPDTDEVNGFQFNGQVWSTNPFFADTNADGLTDREEWPAPLGNAPSWDIDGDGLPNVWDPDNDNDLVPDDTDLSPFTATGYLDSYKFSTQGQGFDGFQTIAIQVQPQDPDHLRYTTTALDWPNDDNDAENGGQVVDLDNSTEDVRLYPMLEILTNQAPDILAPVDNITVLVNEDKATKDSYPHRLLVPLSPAGDGGQIVTFNAQIRYEERELANIRWEKMRLVWFAEMNVDSQNGDQVIVDNMTAYTYEDRFRVTGLSVDLSGDSEIALVGTPNTPQDDRQLFQTMFGLSATFMEHLQPDLDEIETRFSGSGTPLEQTWGVPSSQLTINLSKYETYEQGALDTAVNRVHTFLNSNYTAQKDEQASLIHAYQTKRGSINLDDSGVRLNGNTFSADIRAADISTIRGLRLALYQHDGTSWIELDEVDSLALIDERYQNMDTVLNELKQTYPKLEKSDLTAVLVMMYSVWLGGVGLPVAFNGNATSAASKPDQQVTNTFSKPDTHLVSYLITVGRFAEPGAGLRITDSVTTQIRYLRSLDQITNAISVSLGALNAMPEIKEATFKDKAKKYSKWGKAALKLKKAQTVYKLGKYVYYSVQVGVTVGKSAVAAGKAASSLKALKTISKFGKAMAVVGNALSIGLAWYAFAEAYKSGDPVARNNALSYAITATVFYIALTVCSFIFPCNYSDPSCQC